MIIFSKSKSFSPEIRFNKIIFDFQIGSVRRHPALDEHLFILFVNLLEINMGKFKITLEMRAEAGLEQATPHHLCHRNPIQLKP